MTFDEGTSSPSVGVSDTKSPRLARSRKQVEDGNGSDIGTVRLSTKRGDWVAIIRCFHCLEKLVSIQCFHLHPAF